MSNLQFGPYVLNRRLRRLTKGGVVVPLPSKAFDLLVFLALNAGRPLLKNELLESVWPGAFVEESNLTQNVFLLRKAFGAEGDSLIATLPGRGYQFTAEVAEVEVAMQETAMAVPEVAGLEARRSRVVIEEETEERIDLRRSPLAMAFVGTGLVLLVLSGWLGWQRWEDHIGGPPVQVVLTDFDGSTGDPVLDRTLKDVLRFNLMQSPFVNVVSPGTVKALLPLMRLKPSDALTVDIARDLCERTASQAVLHGSLARFGNQYVVTEEATSCVNGATLGTAKQEVARSEDLPRALDRIGATLRHDLGESRRMIARFNRPLASQDTGSLEALKDFSQAAYLSQSGKFSEAIDLLKQAVGLDPQFAAAYFNLAAYSSDILDPAAARVYLQKAYDLREFSTEPTRLTITAFYQTDITGDLYESVRTYRAWISLYPRNAQAWNGLALALGQLGRFPEALEPARRHLELLPGYAAAYEELAYVQMANEDFAGARKTCDAALNHGIDVEMLRERLLYLGHVTHDATLIAAQERWGDKHPDSPALFSAEAAFAAAEGRLRDAQQLLDRMDDAFRQQGTPTAGVRLRQISARAEFELGKPELAKAQLHLALIDANEWEELVALAETGEPDAAAAMLRDQVASHPHSTLWNHRFAPLFRAQAALLTGKPADALAVLQPSTLFGEFDIDTAYLRGEAYMHTRQFPQAEAEFRALLAHPGVVPESFQLPLSQLHLARALAAEGRGPEAAEAYRSFLQAWSHADAGSLLLKQATSELAGLKTTSAP